MKFKNIFKMGRDGTIREKSESGVYQTYQSKPSLLCFITPSLKEIMRIFGENIIELKGSREVVNEKNDNKISGFNFYEHKKNGCLFHYNKTKDGILDKLEQNRILNLIKYYNLTDCVVEYLKVKIKDDELKDLLNDLFKGKINFKVQASEFIAEFKISKCESEIDRGVWDGENYNEDVLSPIGFKKSMLHLVRLIDVGQAYNIKKETSKFYYINWEPDDKSIQIWQLKSPEEICLFLKSKLNKYGYIKSYKLDKQNKLILTGMS